MAYVYLIIEEPHPNEQESQWVKIGYTKNPPEWRLYANLMRGNSRTLSIAIAFEYESESAARGAERAAHVEFAKQHHQKEWFNVDWRTVKRWFELQGAKPRALVGG